MGARAWVKERRWELTIGVVITAAVVGIPWVSNGGLSGNGGSSQNATATTTAGPGGSAPSVLGATLDANGAPTAPSGSGDDDFLSLLQGITAPPTTAGTAPAPSTTPTSAPIPVTTATTTRPPTTTSPSTAPKPRPTPRAPTGLTLDFGGTALAVGWDAVTLESDGSPFNGGYQLTVGTGGTTKTYPLAGTAFTYDLDQNRADFGLPQAELTVTVRAVDGAGSASAPATGVAAHEPPATPTAAPILAAGVGEITVIGQLPAGASDIAGFDVYEYQPGTPVPYALLGPTMGIGAYVHIGLPAGSTHTYVYRTRDVFGQTSAGYSPAATATAS